MKLGLLYALTVITIFAQSAEAQYKRPGEDTDLCPEKKALVSGEGKTVVGCSCTNFGKALTADFQPIIGHPLTSKVSDIKARRTNDLAYSHALEHYYGIQNMKQYSTYPQDGGFGAPLLAKFSTALANTPGDPEALGYVQHTIVPNTQYRPVSPATGSCEIWSAWSLDREVREMMDKVNGGIVCSGVPFTKGELKELITSVYPDPSPFMTRNELKGYYDPDKFGVWDPNQRKMVSTSTRTDKEVEDANLALVKLGDFGAGSGFSPEALVTGAKALKDAGSTMIMDLDPGTRDVWNQPIEAVVDVSYTVSSQEKNSYLRFQDLTTANQPAASANPQDPLLKQLQSAEAQISYQSLTGIVRVSSELERFRAMAGEQAQLNPYTPLLEQVSELKRVQQKLIENGQFKVNPNSNVVRHRIFIQYGQESDFALNGEMPSATRELDYVSVNGRANWSPPTRKLSEACKDGNIGKRVTLPGYGLVANVSTLKQDCAQATAPGGDRDIAVGAFPPKFINVYNMKTGDARFAGSDDGKRRTYNRLRDMILHCNDDKHGSFEGAGQFMQSLKAAISMNDVTSKIPALKEAYLQSKDFLDDPRAGADQNFVKQVIMEESQKAGGDANKIAGLTALYHSLFP